MKLSMGRRREDEVRPARYREGCRAGAEGSVEALPTTEAPPSSTSRPPWWSSKTSAIGAYGSKVAGYARPDSDYDLIIVAKRFREWDQVQVRRTAGGGSALIVDEEMLDEDAASSFLGEFVVGRLLNVYESIINAELLRRGRGRVQEEGDSRGPT